MPKRLTSTDFYSGVGGWACGLRMAGIDVVRSYEKWDRANETNRRNNGHEVRQCDIREVSIPDVPHTPVIVGSPPCTQFSLSNRGGSGDIVDGLKDIAAFLRIVLQLKPKHWVMENVPNVASIVSRELLPGGQLQEFRDLKLEVRVFDLADFGLPQRRRRCLIGNIDFDLLDSYTRVLPRRTLGEVIETLSQNPVVDPVYGFTLSADALFDHIFEESLNAEEERINKAAKTLHPVYNAMSFPDRVDRPSRTITATCTRVSRESVVIEAPSKPGTFRRLTIRERASAQGFPITYGFFGNTYAQKLRMVGNALPPLFAFYVGHAIKGTLAPELPTVLQESDSTHQPRHTPPEKPAFKYPKTRRFRFAIPSLRMKSGMRFELTNGAAPVVDWHVQYVFGSSKKILQLRPDEALLKDFMRELPEATRNLVGKELAEFQDYLENVDVRHLQDVWSHRGPGLTRPLLLLDEISSVAERLTSMLDLCGAEIFPVISAAIGGANADKVMNHSPRIYAGMLVSAVTNSVLSTEPVELSEGLVDPIHRKKRTA